MNQYTGVASHRSFPGGIPQKGFGHEGEVFHENEMMKKMKVR